MHMKEQKCENPSVTLKEIAKEFNVSYDKLTRRHRGKLQELAANVRTSAWMTLNIRHYIVI